MTRILSAQALKVRGDKAKEADRAHLFALLCRQRDLPEPEREHAFAKPDGRKWRFDFAWPDYHVALEVEGGVYVRGAHQRPKKFLDDVEKYNAAALRGWRVLRTIPERLCTSETIDMLTLALGVGPR